MMTTALHVVGTVVVLQFIAICVGLFVSAVCDRDTSWSRIGDVTALVIGALALLYGLTIPLLIIAWIWS